MDYQELALESLSTLALNKIRTGLAMLGVIIGIGSVIALVSLGQASQKSVKAQIQSLGANLLTVMPGAPVAGGVRGAAGGVTPQYATIRNVVLASGSFIAEQHLTSLSKVAVLGPQAAADLFGEAVNPIGQTVRLSGITFKLIGLTESKGGMGPMSDDDKIFVPLTTAQKILFGVDYVSSIYIEAVNENVMNQAMKEVGFLLLKRHKIKDPLLADFSIMSQEDILSTMTEVTSTFTTLLSGIAAISLIVGGIGIMNIMLVTVTERTREIGLRKALGAKKKWITVQFLLEALIITFVGGLVGMTVGVGVSFLIAHFLDLPPTLSLSAVFLAFAVSAGVGILFGWYPAQKAANLEPIDALRYE